MEAGGPVVQGFLPVQVLHGEPLSSHLSYTANVQHCYMIEKTQWSLFLMINVVA
jgi:hypothetical protein